jgi:hypothetical protein
LPCSTQGCASAAIKSAETERVHNKAEKLRRAELTEEPADEAA